MNTNDDHMHQIPRIVAAFDKVGITVRRGNSYDPVEKHGFISSQRMGYGRIQAHPSRGPADCG